MKKSDRPLWITGHSLGGALALLAAWLLKRCFIAVHQIYTYGAPMIGNQKASDAFNKEFKGQIFRYVSGRDPIPKLPGLSLVANEFTHVESATVLGTDPMTDLPQFPGAIGSQGVKGILAGSLIDETWKYVNEQVSAHFLDSYDGLLKK